MWFLRDPLWYWRRLLRVPWTARRSNQSILKEINSEYSLEGLMLKLKLQYFGHLMWRADSLEETLMLEKMEGKRSKGWQRMRWLDSITNPVDVNLSKLQEIVKDRGACHAAVHGILEGWIQLSDWTTANCPVRPQQLVRKGKVCFIDTCENPQGSWNYWERKSLSFLLSKRRSQPWRVDRQIQRSLNYAHRSINSSAYSNTYTIVLDNAYFGRSWCWRCISKILRLFLRVRRSFSLPKQAISEQAFFKTQDSFYYNFSKHINCIRKMWTIFLTDRVVPQPKWKVDMICSCGLITKPF